MPDVPSLPMMSIIERQRRAARATRQTMLDPIEQWMDDANCVGCDPDSFFPAEGFNNIPRRLYFQRRVCANCGVQPECADYALRIGANTGLWAGVLIHNDKDWHQTLRRKAREMDQ